jgi:hypothetical protein
MRLCATHSSALSCYLFIALICKPSNVFVRRVIHIAGAVQHPATAIEQRWQTSILKIRIHSMLSAFLDVFLPETSEYKKLLVCEWSHKLEKSKNSLDLRMRTKHTICYQGCSFRKFYFLPCLRCNYISRMERCTENILKLIWILRTNDKLSNNSSERC